MRILIREVRRTAGDSFEHSDSSRDVDVVTIGRSTDQVVQLHDRRLALSHSEMRADGDHLVIRAVGEEHFFVNGKRTRSAKLSVGDEVEFGAYVLRVVEPPEDHDFALDIEAGELSEQEVTFGSQFRQGLEQTRLSRRGWAWTLTLVILIGLLVIPALGLLDRELGIAMRDAPVPDDGVWLSGPMHASHRFMGDDCTACHVEAFTMVRDQECIACHQSVSHHVDTSVHQLPELEEQRCASCHKEHNEPSVLSRRDQGLCADCHDDLESRTDGEVSVADVSDFEADHPEFNLSMLVGEGRGDDMDWHVERVALSDPEIAEESNLIFPHDEHMAPGGIDGPTGEVVMQCTDCHQPESGGAYMQPISMEQHCSDCHQLTFDEDAPARELPHGEPDLVVRLLEEYYARQVLAGGPMEPGEPGRTARRPGAERATPARESADPEAGLREARRQAMQAAEDIFERTTCKTCHEVDRIDDPERDSPWQVQPVRLAQVWMPKSWFSHAAHETEECARCHGAENSTTAADVLMPDVESCRDCHGGGESENKLASTCIDCHVFHLPSEDLMKPDVPGARPADPRSDLEVMRAGRVDQLTPVRAD